MLDLLIDNSTGTARGLKIEPTPVDKLVEKYAVVDDFDGLNVGVPIVHSECGVGLLSELEHIDPGAFENEFLALEYAENGKVYVQIRAMHLHVKMYLHVDGSVVLFSVDVAGTAQPEVLSSFATQFTDRFIRSSPCEIKANFATDVERELHTLVIRTLTQCRDDHLDSASKAA